MPRNGNGPHPPAAFGEAGTPSQTNISDTIVAWLIAEYKRTAIHATRRARVARVALFAARYRRIASEARDAARRLEASI